MAPESGAIRADPRVDLEIETVDVDVTLAQLLRPAVHQGPRMILLTAALDQKQVFGCRHARRKCGGHEATGARRGLYRRGETQGQ